MRRTIRTLTIAALVATLLVTSAAVGGGSASAAAPVKAKPAAWAKTVCTSLTTWIGSIESVSADASATPPATPADGKKALVKMVNASIAATKKLVKKVKKVGAPAVENGSSVQSIVLGQLKQVQSTLTGAKATLQQLPTDDPAAFVAQSRTAQDAIEAGLEGVQAAINAASDLDIEPLVAAFNAEASCQSLMG
jgi:hypothetical protein